jgi:hypothetical protein
MMRVYKGNCFVVCTSDLFHVVTLHYHAKLKSTCVCVTHVSRLFCAKLLSQVINGLVEDLLTRLMTQQNNLSSR